MATDITQDQQSQGSGFSLPNIPTGMPNMPGMPKTRDLLRKGGQKMEQVASRAAEKLLQKAALTPQFWIGVAIVLAILVVVALFLIIITTIVGGSNGGTPTPAPTAAPGPAPVSNNILSWGQQISNSLQTYPTSCYGTFIYNVMLQTITNGSYAARQKPGSACGLSGSSYYCTNLVIDSYNLAGIKNNFSQWVPAMIGQWTSVPGLTVKQNSSVEGLQPGDVVFWLILDNAITAQHVDMIQSVDVSTDGNGTLTTIDANTNSKVNKFYVRNWNLIGKWLVGNVAWFGLGPR
jgi:hypothetical protein